MPSFPWLPVPLIQFKLQLWVVLTNPLISLLPINHLTTAPAEHSRALSPNHLLSLNTRVATSFLVSILTLTSLHYFLRNNSVHMASLSLPDLLTSLWLGTLSCYLLCFEYTWHWQTDTFWQNALAVTQNSVFLFSCYCQFTLFLFLPPSNGLQ